MTAPFVAPAPPSGKQWVLAWNDEFTGSTLDNTKWNIGWQKAPVASPSALGVQNQTASPVGNTETEYYGPAGVTVTGGTCHLNMIAPVDLPTHGIAHSEAGMITTGNLMLINPLGITSGVPAVRANLTGPQVWEFLVWFSGPSSGADWQVIWSSCGGNAGNGTGWGLAGSNFYELDWWEQNGGTSTGASYDGHFHGDILGDSAGFTTVPGSLNGLDFSAGFNTFTMWTDGVNIKFYVNGTLANTVSCVRGANNVWDQPHFLMLANQARSLESNPRPAMQIEYVRGFTAQTVTSVPQWWQSVGISWGTAGAWSTTVQNNLHAKWFTTDRVASTPRYDYYPQNAISRGWTPGAAASDSYWPDIDDFVSRAVFSGASDILVIVNTRNPGFGAYRDDGDFVSAANASKVTAFCTALAAHLHAKFPTTKFDYECGNEVVLMADAGGAHSLSKYAWMYSWMYPGLKVGDGTCRVSPGSTLHAPTVQIETWTSGATYNTGNVVTRASHFWQATTNHTASSGNAPGVGGAPWTDLGFGVNGSNFYGVGATTRSLSGRIWTATDWTLDYVNDTNGILNGAPRLQTVGCDFYCVHPYAQEEGVNGLFGDAPGAVTGNTFVNGWRELVYIGFTLRTVGIGAPMWATEFGFTTAPAWTVGTNASVGTVMFPNQGSAKPDGRNWNRPPVYIAVAATSSQPGTSGAWAALPGAWSFWTSPHTYTAGTVLIDNGHMWYCTTNHTSSSGNRPGTGGAPWTDLGAAYGAGESPNVFSTESEASFQVDQALRQWFGTLTTIDGGNLGPLTGRIFFFQPLDEPVAGGFRYGIEVSISGTVAVDKGSPTIYSRLFNGRNNIDNRDVNAPTAPTAPVSVSAAVGNGSSVVSWGPPANDGGATVDTYRVTASPGGATRTTAAPSTSVNFTALTNGTTYTFTVAAHNTAGWSAESAASNAVTPSGSGASPPGAPTGVVAIARNHGATVAYDPPLSNGGATIDFYRVVAVPDNIIFDSLGLSVLYTGLVVGRTYTFWVVAHNSAGFGTASNISNPVVPFDVQPGDCIGPNDPIDPNSPDYDANGCPVVPPAPNPEVTIGDGTLYPAAPYTDAQILDLDGVLTRVDTFAYTLLDASGAEIGTVNPSAGSGSGPSVRVDTTATSMWTLQNLIIPPGIIDDIDPLRDRLRVDMILQNGSVYPLGVYLFGQYTRTPTTWGSPFAPSMFDLMFIVNQPLGATLSITRGASATASFVQLANDVGITNISVETNDVIVGNAPLAFAANTSRFDVLARLAQLMGGLTPHFTADGTLRVRSAPSPTGIGADHTYDIGGRIVAGSMTETNDSYQAPNRYIVVSTGSTATVVGRFDVPDGAPHSIASRGFVVGQSTDVSGLTTNSAADLVALAIYILDTRSYQKATFASPADPRHGVFDTVRYRGNMYVETGWTLDCRSGGSHQHEVTRLWEDGI